MGHVDVRFPARARTALEVFEQLVEYFYAGQRTQIEAVHEYEDGAFRFVFRAHEPSSGGGSWQNHEIRVRLGCWQGVGRSCWLAAAVEVRNLVFAGDDLCALADRMQAKGICLSHGYEHVMDREMAQLELPGIEPEPAQGHLPLGYDSGLRLFC